MTAALQRAKCHVVDFFEKLRALYVLPRSLRPAFLLYFPLGFLNVTSYKLYLPLLRSLVVCDVPPGPGPAAFTGSVYCGDRDLVIAVALQQEAWLVGVKLLFRMASGPVLGHLCDKHGRKPVLLAGIAGLTVTFLLMVLACVQSFVPTLAILTLALSIQGSSTAFGLCYKAMIADSIQGAERAKGFVVLNHVDVLSRGLTLVFVIYIQKIQFVHYEWLCLAAAVVGAALLLYCYCYMPETLPAASDAPAASNGHASSAGKSNGSAGAAGAGAQKDVATRGDGGATALEMLRAKLLGLGTPLKLLRRSTFLQLRLLHMGLMQLSSGWESVQDSFMIAVLGWGPGDWDLMNVPISSFRELWGMLSSGVMVHWASSQTNNFRYVKASLTFNLLMRAVQIFAPFGAIFMLVPRYLLALVPGDGGAEAALFSSQFPSDVQATAAGFLMAADNFASAVARALYARYFFDPSARGWSATYPLLVRIVFKVLGSAVSFYVWRRFGAAMHKKAD